MKVPIELKWVGVTLVFCAVFIGGVEYCTSYIALRRTHMLVRWEHWGGREHVIVPHYYSVLSEQIEHYPWTPVHRRDCGTYTASASSIRSARWKGLFYWPLRKIESWLWQLTGYDEDLNRRSQRKQSFYTQNPVKGWQSSMKSDSS